MAEEKLSLGQAIDQISLALSSLEPDSRTVALKAVCDHLGISLPGGTTSLPAQSPEAKPGAAPPAMPSVDPPPAPSRRAAKDIRTLKEEKQPKSAQQMACVVAYYLSELAGEDERSETVTTADLEKYFKQAGFKLPEDIKQVLKNAKRAGYFESAERGHYKLNAVGYNLVTHGLPAGGE
ncbi:MAG: hypothetical protein KZQ93_20260 [Candidatus Thiodiazotropha sp. (ex Monitilora ramsayi)]|nr:hypothetical protein [Candidatus Thiodiazotropha sp. (ex Monitilora ramsayi)]